MPSYLSLSRAARLAGITRAELQKRIRRGEIATFEGSVAVEDLLRLYPSVSLQDEAGLERVERIKRDAQPRLTTVDTTLPSPEVLLSRLRGLSETLASKMSTLAAMEDLIGALDERLAELTRAAPERLPEGLRETRSWLAESRRRLEEDSPTPDQHTRLYAKDTLLRLMAANVKLIPSGHDFFVEGNESILDASVRAGLKLGYGCSSGNCGDCKARLIDGETAKIRDHDYVISERERAMGYILTCSQTAVTDLVIEAAEATSVADLPIQQIRASLRKQERISPDLMLLNIQTPRTQTLRFMAGQRMRLTLEEGASGELPIASCPCNGRSLWVYVRRRDTDPFSRRVFEGLRPGQLVMLEGPYGDFVLTEDAPEPAIFIAFGDGIAPIKSLIEHAVSIDLIESFHLYWDTTYPEGHQHQAQWARALRDALDNFSFTPLMCGRADETVTVARSDHLDLQGLRFYIAGPGGLAERAREELAAIGVPDQRILSEETSS